MMKITDTPIEKTEDAASEEEKTPRKRGRPRKSTTTPKKTTPKKKTPTKQHSTPRTVKKRGRKRKAEVNDDGAEYEVEAILLSRHNKDEKRDEYYVKWKGWSIEDATWEPANKVKEDVPKIVDTFENELKHKIPKEYRNVQDNNIPLKCTSLLDSRPKAKVSMLRLIRNIIRVKEQNIW
jgi:hypothetical protein